jgi:HAD superfamily hydrolase (TIGR01484 family)
MKKHFIFDMDGTITESKTLVSDTMIGRLLEIVELGNTLTIISGATLDQIKIQLAPLLVHLKPDQIFLMAQSGTECKYWKYKLSEQHKVEVYRHITQVKKLLKEKLINCNEADTVQDRKTQISYSLLGHNADLETKKMFDPYQKLRQEILKTVPFHSLSMTVKIGGTTCLDYTLKEHTKGKNIEALIKHNNWKLEDCIYFGDALQEGGNDHTVVGIIETCAVGSPRDTLLAVRDYLDK